MEQKPKQPIVTTSKRPYKSPEIQVYGTLTDITRNNLPSGNTDTVNVNHGKTHA